jgi:fatty-acid desaturase
MHGCCSCCCHSGWYNIVIVILWLIVAEIFLVGVVWCDGFVAGCRLSWQWQYSIAVAIVVEIAAAAVVVVMVVGCVAVGGSCCCFVGRHRRHDRSSCRDRDIPR